MNQLIKKMYLTKIVHQTASIDDKNIEFYKILLNINSYIFNSL